jgi:hypothetical protein
MPPYVLNSVELAFLIQYHIVNMSACMVQVG